MNKKSIISQLIATLNIELTAVEARSEEIAMIVDDMVESGKVDHQEAMVSLDLEYSKAQARIKELNRLVFEVSQPKRNICRNTQNLVAQNID